MLCSADVLVYNPQTGKLKNSWCLNCQINPLIVRLHGSDQVTYLSFSPNLKLFHRAPLWLNKSLQKYLYNSYILMTLTSEMRKIQIKCMKIKSHLPAQRLIVIQTMRPAPLYAFSTHSNNEYRKTLVRHYYSNFRTFIFIYVVLSIGNSI